MLAEIWNKRSRLCVYRNTKVLSVLTVAVFVYTIWICCSSFIVTSSPESKISNKIDYYMKETLTRPSPLTCTNNPYLIILVSSNVHHSTRRLAIRTNLPIISLKTVNFVRIFMTGKAKEESSPAQKRIDSENRYFGDILQGSFEEHYRNSTYKTLMGLRWVTTACANASYILKVNDNYTLGLKETLMLLQNLDGRDKYDLIVGTRLIQKVPVRNPKFSKNSDYLQWEEYGSLFFPPYVSGRDYYVTTPQVAARLTREAPNHQYLFLEDVFVTGILTEALRIPVRDIPEIGFPKYVYN